MRRVDSLINTKKSFTSRTFDFMSLSDRSIAHGIIARNNPDWDLSYDQVMKFLEDAQAKGYEILIVNDDHLKVMKNGAEEARIPKAEDREDLKRMGLGSSVQSLKTDQGQAI